MESKHLFPITLALALILNLSAAAPRQDPTAPRPQNPSPMVDTTRPHPRIARRDVEGQRIELSRGTLFLSPRFNLRGSIPLVIHFHGAPWLVEYLASRSLPAVAVVSVQLGAGSRVYENAFTPAGSIEHLMSEAAAHLGNYKNRPVRWSGVTLSAFSAGYGAVRAILRHREGYDLVSSIILADALHTAYVPEGAPGLLEEAPLEPFVRFAKDAAEGRKRLLITHSEVFPGTFASTTETADHILQDLGLKRRPLLRQGPIGMQQLSIVERRGFRLLGFAGNSAPDHMDHLYALDVWLHLAVRP